MESFGTPSLASSLPALIARWLAGRLTGRQAGRQGEADSPGSACTSSERARAQRTSARDSFRLGGCASSALLCSGTASCQPATPALPFPGWRTYGDRLGVVES